MAEPAAGTILGGARMTDHLIVPFEGPGAGVGGLTWGQQKVWALMEVADSSLPMGGVVPVADGKTAEDLAGELRFFLSRYGSMRARIRTGADGELIQEVYGSGEATLGIIDVADDADPAGAARELADRWAETIFDYAGEWPIRMAAIRHRGEVTHVVVTISHIATDGGGIAVMLGDLAERDPVTGEAKNPPSAMGPLELVELQRTDPVVRQGDASLRYWERLLRAAAPRRFGPRVEHGEPRYRQAHFESRALHLASKVVAARVGGSASSVVLAGYAVAVARMTGANPGLIQVVVSNRFRPGLADVSHPLSVNGLLLVDLADATFDEAVDRTQRALTLCSKYAYYNPILLEELRARVDQERGEAVDLACVFNERRLDIGIEQPGPVPPRQELEAALADTVMQWGKPFTRFGEKLMIQVDDVPDVVKLLILVDSYYVPFKDVESMVQDLESLVLQAAYDPNLPTKVQRAQ